MWSFAASATMSCWACLPHEREEEDPGELPRPGDRTTQAVWHLGGIAVPRDRWELLCAHGAPAWSALRVLERHELELLWRISAPHPLRQQALLSVDDLVRDKLLTSTSQDGPPPSEALRKLEAWFGTSPAEPVRGELVAPDSAGAQMVTLTFEGGNTVWDWHAYAIHDQAIVPAFGERLVLAPG